MAAYLLGNKMASAGVYVCMQVLITPLLWVCTHATWTKAFNLWWWVATSVPITASACCGNLAPIKVWSPSITWSLDFLPCFTASLWRAGAVSSIWWDRKVALCCCWRHSLFLLFVVVVFKLLLFFLVYVMYITMWVFWCCFLLLMLLWLPMMMMLLLLWLLWLYSSLP